MNKENTAHLPNVLSVFDGMSCGQVALERAGITYDNYFASEIDKYAIKIANKNYPKTTQLGTIVNWREWNLPKIDLFIGGSPCQGFSNAGLGLNFDDPRSKLFFTYVDILNDLREKNPDLIFLLENVKMKKEWRDIITKLMSVEPIEINSALVSAQNRKRIYWTNIPNIEQPKDRFIFLKDIIEDGEVDREKSYTVDANYFKGGNPRSYFEDGKRQLVFEHQSQKRAMVKTIGHGYIKEKEEEMDKYPSLYAQDPSSKHLIVSEATKRGTVEIFQGEGVDLSFPTSTTPRGRRMEDKCNALQAGQQDLNWYDGFTCRKLTVTECERLQTLPNNYTNGVSNTQRYKMIGNGWTVEVIVHIFRNIRVAEPLNA